MSQGLGGKFAFKITGLGMKSDGIRHHRGCSRATGFSLVEIMILVALIGLLATIAIPNFVRARLKSQQSTCITNLRMLESAKQNWSEEPRAPQPALPVIGEIHPFLTHEAQAKAPPCPAD